MTNVRCKYWELGVNDGPIEPVLGATVSFVAIFSSVAVGLGEAVAVSTKDLYEVARRKADAVEAEAAAHSPLHHRAKSAEESSLSEEDSISSSDQTPPTP
jgi:hypothetical protein